MGDIIKWVVIVSIRVGFWSSIIFTFVPLLTIIVSAILISVDHTVLADLYYMIQLWLPFNLNVILLWSLSLATAFGLWWLAQKLYFLLNSLIKA